MDGRSVDRSIGLFCDYSLGTRLSTCVRFRREKMGRLLPNGTEVNGSIPLVLFNRQQAIVWSILSLTDGHVIQLILTVKMGDIWSMRTQKKKKKKKNRRISSSYQSSFFTLSISWFLVISLMSGRPTWHLFPLLAIIQSTDWSNSKRISMLPTIWISSRKRLDFLFPVYYYFFFFPPSFLLIFPRLFVREIHIVNGFA